MSALADRIGKPILGTHWLRASRWFGQPPPGFALRVELFWPVSDAHPTTHWWL
jgi:hypothetical protein